MVRRAARVDGNQPDIVLAFRRLGCSVVQLHMVGNGCPDICIAKHGINVLVEIKDGNKPKSARALTADEKKFHAAWLGPLHIVETIDDVVSLVTLIEEYTCLLRQ